MHRSNLLNPRESLVRLVACKDPRRTVVQTDGRVCIMVGVAHMTHSSFSFAEWARLPVTACRPLPPTEMSPFDRN